MKATTEYAVLIILCLASYGGMRSTKDIAAFTGVPAPVVIQVASRLRQARLIDSARGRVGGYCLPHATGDMSLLNIVETMEGREDAIACVFPKASLSCRKLGADPVSQSGAERLASALQALTLVSIRMDGLLREATLDRLVLGREGPSVLNDFSVRRSAQPTRRSSSGLPKTVEKKGEGL